MKNLFTRRAAEKGRWSNERLQMITETFGVSAILLLLVSVVGFQLGKWGQRLQNAGLQQWAFWGDLAGGLAIVLMAAALAPIALRGIRTWILEDEERRLARIPDLEGAAAEAVLATVAGGLLLVLSQILHIAVSRSGHYAETPAALVSSLAGGALVTGFLAVGTGIAFGLFSAAHHLARNVGKP